MIKQPPEFVKPKHYIERARIHGSRWRFNTSIDNELELCDSLAINETISFCDKDNREWLRIDKNKVILRAGYAWNGCSPKICLFGVWVGTPDFDETNQGSAFHDAFVQFFKTEHFPFTKKEVDLIFYHTLNKNGFDGAFLYYSAVDKFGKYKSKQGENSYIIDGACANGLFSNDTHGWVERSNS